MQEKYLNREQMQAILDTRPKSISLKDAIDTYVKNGWTIQDINDQNLKSNQSVANKYGSEGSNVPATTIEPNPIAQSFGKTVNNLADRATQVGSAVKNVGTDLSNAQTLPEAAKVVGKNFVSATGAVGAGLNDILGGGIAVAAKGIDQMSGGKLGDIGSKAVSSLLNTETGKRAVQAISEGAQSWSDFEKANPEESKVYSDIFNTLNIIPTGNIIKAGVKSAARGAEFAANTAENVVNTVGDIAARGVKNTFEAGKTVVSKAPKVNLGKDTTDYLNKIYKDSPLPANEILASKNKVENALGMFKTTPIEVTNVKTGAKEAFDIKKATHQQIFEAVNNLSKNVTESHKSVLKELSKTPDNLIKDFSDVEALLGQKFNDGYISKALKTKILKQLDATGGDLDKVDDWIVNANKYFGSQADTRVVSQDVAKLLRAKLENVVDRAGYADSFGSVQELKRLIINSIAKETKNQELLKSVADNGIDVAFNVLTKNPIGLAIKGTQGLKKLFGGTGDIKLIKKAGSKATPTSVKGVDIKKKVLTKVIDTEDLQTDISMSKDVNNFLGREYSRQDILSEIDKIKSSNYYDKSSFNDFVDAISNGNRTILIKLYRASKVAKNTLSETLQSSKNKGKLAKEYDKLAQELGNFKDEDALSFIEKKISEYEYARNSFISKQNRLKKLESELKKYSK